PSTQRWPTVVLASAQSLPASALRPAISASLPPATPPSSCSPPHAPLLQIALIPAEFRPQTAPPSFRQSPSRSSTAVPSSAAPGTAHPSNCHASRCTPPTP